MTKKKIEIIASRDSYENLATFHSIDKLNETVRTYKETYKDQLNKTDIAVLDILHRHSAKYTGVSFLTKNSIAKMVDRTRRTIINICNKLESLGILKQYATKRKSDMQQTSNAIAILPIQDSEQEVKNEESNQNFTQETQKISHQKNNIFLKQKHNINHLNMTKASKRTPYIKLVPKHLQHYQAFLGDKIKILYGRVWLAMKKLDVHIDKDIMRTIAHIAFDKLVDYIKEGRNLTAEQMNKIVYTISYNQLSEREDTKDIVKDQQAITHALILLDKPSENKKVPSLSLFADVIGV
ncbi:hypothetical protein ABE049_21375 [Priestia megaterium]